MFGEQIKPLEPQDKSDRRIRRVRREEPGGGDVSRAEVLSRAQEEGRRDRGAVGGGGGGGSRRSSGERGKRG